MLSYMRFIITAVVAYLMYLILTIGSGSLLLWSEAELIIGAIFALVVAALVKNRFLKTNLRMLNPRRWFTGLVYLLPFFIAMAQANIDVAYRVLTGKINPGIVKISPNLKTDMALTILANSITLTPGTLSVDVEKDTNNLYVHWINVKPEVLKDMPRDYHPICHEFPDWARRIAD